jgi:pumilio family protein 6
LVQERKAAKPLADELARTKKLWERLRRKSHVPVDERKKLVTELFEIITGRVKDYVLKHDSVRVVQTAIKYANPDQKRMIAKELAGTYRELAESKYAKFLIGKLLVQGDDEIRDIIVPEFFGHVRRLIKHPEASWILDDVYRGVATKQQKAVLLREWYGAEFALFQKDEKVTSELSEILEADPGKRAPIMRYLQELINHLIQKKLTGFTMLHDAMLQYFLNAKAGTEEITDFIELLKGDEEGDLLKNLAFTKSGARVVSLALAYGNAKDRRAILKAYKDTLQLMAADPNGHIVILTAYEVIDDTVSTAKAIFPELLTKDSTKQIEMIVSGVNDLNARTTLMYLFQGRSPSLFPPCLSDDLKVLEEVCQIRTATSKKAPEIRRSELAKALSPYLLNAISVAAMDLVTTSFGCQLITDVILNADGDKSEALAAVAVTAGGSPSGSENVRKPEKADAKALKIEEALRRSSSISSDNSAAAAADTVMTDGDISEAPPHVAATYWGGRLLKTLVQGGKFDKKAKALVPVDPPLDFANILYPHVKDYLVEWATGPSSWIVSGLLDSDFAQKDEAIKTLREGKKAIKKAAVEETPEQEARREQYEAAEAAVVGVASLALKGKNIKKVRKAKNSKPLVVGNPGAAAVLERI